MDYLSSLVEHLPVDRRHLRRILAISESMHFSLCELIFCLIKDHILRIDQQSDCVKGARCRNLDVMGSSLLTDGVKKNHVSQTKGKNVHGGSPLGLMSFKMAGP